MMFVIRLFLKDNYNNFIFFTIFNFNIEFKTLYSLTSSTSLPVSFSSSSSSSAFIPTPIVNGGK